MSKFFKVIIFLLGIYLLFAVYSLFVPRYIDKSELWSQYPNRRCRCYGLYLKGKGVYNPAADPCYDVSETCIGLQGDCAVFTKEGWDKELYKEIAK
jgi:hypothetical protein